MTTDPDALDSTGDLLQKIVLRARTIWGITSPETAPDSGELTFELYRKWLLALNQTP